MGIWMLIISSLYFFLPAYGANMAPELFRWVPFLDKPIWKKKLGANKTWRGVVVAVIVGVVVFSLQQWLFRFELFYNISLIDYGDFNWQLGFLLGFGAILGDAVGSYYKRRARIKPGESWKPWDQVDFAFGGLALGCLVYVPQIMVPVIVLVASFFLHMLFCRFGYWLGIKKRKF
ncbi:CDP-archaeol synthase [Candidatus Woesearchaeota archaeon]|nr:CDP-archaeol synthase [Candidatus Woesearchaeota archaeon]